MDRRSLLKGMLAAPVAAALPSAAPMVENKVALFGSSPEMTFVCDLGRDGLWRILPSGEPVPGNDVDAYMDDFIAAAKAA